MRCALERIIGAKGGPYRREADELDGTLFPTFDDARGAQYEAGALQYFIYLDTVHFPKALAITGL